MYIDGLTEDVADSNNNEQIWRDFIDRVLQIATYLCRMQHDTECIRQVVSRQIIQSGYMARDRVVNYTVILKRRIVGRVCWG
jgi:hypothetical protein